MQRPDAAQQDAAQRGREQHFLPVEEAEEVSSKALISLLSNLPQAPKEAGQI